MNGVVPDAMGEGPGFFTRWCYERAPSPPLNGAATDPLTAASESSAVAAASAEAGALVMMVPEPTEAAATLPVPPFSSSSSTAVFSSRALSTRRARSDAYSPLEAGSSVISSYSSSSSSIAELECPTLSFLSALAATAVAVELGGGGETFRTPTASASTPAIYPPWVGRRGGGPLPFLLSGRVPDPRATLSRGILDVVLSHPAIGSAWTASSLHSLLFPAPIGAAGSTDDGGAAQRSGGGGEAGREGMRGVGSAAADSAAVYAAVAPAHSNYAPGTASKEGVLERVERSYERVHLPVGAASTAPSSSPSSSSFFSAAADSLTVATLALSPSALLLRIARAIDGGLTLRFPRRSAGDALRLIRYAHAARLATNTVLRAGIPPRPVFPTHGGAVGGGLRVGEPRIGVSDSGSGVERAAVIPPFAEQTLICGRRVSPRLTQRAPLSSSRLADSAVGEVAACAVRPSRGGQGVAPPLLSLPVVALRAADPSYADVAATHSSALQGRAQSHQQQSSAPPPPPQLLLPSTLAEEQYPPPAATSAAATDPFIRTLIQRVGAADVGAAGASNGLIARYLDATRPFFVEAGRAVRRDERRRQQQPGDDAGGDGGVGVGVEAAEQHGGGGQRRDDGRMLMMMEEGGGGDDVEMAGGGQGVGAAGHPLPRSVVARHAMRLVGALHVVLRSLDGSLAPVGARIGGGGSSSSSSPLTGRDGALAPHPSSGYTLSFDAPDTAVVGDGCRGDVGGGGGGGRLARFAAQLLQQAAAASDSSSVSSSSATPSGAPSATTLAILDLLHMAAHAEAARRRLGATVVELTARGLHAAAMVVASWLPPAVPVFEGGGDDASGGDVSGGDVSAVAVLAHVRAAFIPLDEWPLPFLVRYHPSAPTPTPTEAYAAGGVGCAAIVGGAQEGRSGLLTGPGAGVPYSAPRPPTVLLSAPSPASTISHGQLLLPRRHQSEGGALLPPQQQQQQPSQPGGAGAGDAPRGALAALLGRLQSYIVCGVLVTPFGQALRHPGAVAQFVTAAGVAATPPLRRATQLVTLTEIMMMPPRPAAAAASPQSSPLSMSSR